MSKRIEFHEKLIEVLGSRNVYFQPPESVRLSYPCIVYKRRSKNDLPADDLKYHSTWLYDVTVIDKNPDTEIPERLESMFPMSRFDRHFTSDNLNHENYVVAYD